MEWLWFRIINFQSSFHRVESVVEGVVEGIRLVTFNPLFIELVASHPLCKDVSLLVLSFQSSFHRAESCGYKIKVKTAVTFNPLFIEFQIFIYRPRAIGIILSILFSSS